MFFVLSVRPGIQYCSALEYCKDLKYKKAFLGLTREAASQSIRLVTWQAVLDSILNHSLHKNTRISIGEGLRSVDDLQVSNGDHVVGIEALDVVGSWCCIGSPREVHRW
ncbi:hypothetical protein ElyMa_006007100 [Elysia marginata]|uniref:Uncharacterized protein n=1 Tax=Elysia marginata TaxID=1093978 RepID=A0AAV4GI06_9GAST|nr:hypothetical protein ElyMa_006007100 [Elysia marginata]